MRTRIRRLAVVATLAVGVFAATGTAGRAAPSAPTVPQTSVVVNGNWFCVVVPWSEVWYCYDGNSL